MSRHGNLFPDLEQKITGSQIWVGFGLDLDDPNIWISGYLGQKSNFWEIPLITNADVTKAAAKIKNSGMD